MIRTILVVLCLCVLVETRAAIDPAALAEARELYGQRMNEEATKAFEALRSGDATAPEPWFYLGLLAMRRDEPEPAAKLLGKAAELNPADAETWRRLGDAYGRAAQKAGLFSRLGFARECREAYERAVAIDPRNVEARFSAMNFYLEAPSFVGGGFDKAHVAADAILAIDAQRGRIAKALVFVREKKFDEAFAVYEPLLKANPDDYFARYQFGRIAAESGTRLDEGIGALQHCLTLTPPEGAPGHGPAHWRIGNIHERKGDLAAARRAYESAVQLEPAFAPAQEALKRLPSS